MRIANSIVETIGRTPLVRLDRLARNSGIEGVNILGKVEFRNPGGSHKDRLALRAIEDAERSGLLKPGMTVVEASSGNLGAGIAVVCAAKGYKCVITMMETMTMERRLMLQALGAEVVLVGLGYPQDVERAKQIAKERGAFFVDQFHNLSNVTAHRETTGREILEDTEGRIDAFVAAAGTAGTLIGVAQALKAFDPKIRVIAVQPPKGTRMAGVGPSAPGWPPFFDAGLIDENISVTDEEARAAVNRLAREEGILAGFSTGGNIAATLRVAKGMAKGLTIVTMINDTGLKYLSTDLFRPTAA